MLGFEQCVTVKFRVKRLLPFGSLHFGKVESEI